MGSIKPLDVEALYQRCDLSQFTFETMDALEDLTEIVGQTRAVEAIRFGTGIRRKGYNLFALGTPGTGGHTVIRQFLAQKAAAEPTPADWCYINNFEQPHKPPALQIPPGQGVVLQRDVAQLVEELRAAIPAVFESEEYRTRKQAIEETFKERQDK